MNIGGNIKVTLSLDDAGFTVKSENAAKGVRELHKGVNTLTSSVSKGEASVKKFGDNVKTTSRDISLLGTSIQKTVKQLSGIEQTQAKLDATSKSLFATFAGLQNVVSSLSTKLGQTTIGMNNAAASGGKLSRANKDAAQSSQALADGMTRQERAARNLGNTQQQVANQVKLSTLGMRDAQARHFAEEIARTDALVARKKESYASMLRAEQAYQNSLNAAKAREMALQMKIDSRKGPDGRFVKQDSEYMRNLQYQLGLEQKRVAALQQSVALIGQQSIKMREAVASTIAQNNSLRQGLTLRERDIANIQRYNTAMREGQQSISAANRARRQEMMQQNAMLREQVGLVKSIGQMWAAMKINQAQQASVHAASAFQMNEVRMRGMGMSANQMSQFDESARQISRQTPGVSYIDAQRGYAAAAGGLATKDNAVIMQTLPQAIAAAKNVQFMQDESGKESLEDLVRNLYGFVEARQQQYQPDAAKNSFDFVLKAYEATGGKIDIKDLETFLRRVGTSANQITDEGLAHVVAMLDQAKVSGGGSGGGAGGVSTIGTMIKMMQAYSAGKTLTNDAVKQYAEAGLINLNGIDPAKQVEAQVTALKRAGLVNSKEMAQDPIKAMTDVANKAFAAMTRNPESIKRYFGSKDADTNDPELRRAAIQRWATSMGMTTTATNAMTMIADPRFQERAAHQREMIKGAMDNEQFTAERMKSYQGAVDNFNSALSNLQVTMGTTVLPMLTQFFQIIEQIAEAANTFAAENPMAAQMTMVAAAVASAVLAIKGMMGMMGMVAKAGAMFGIFGSQASGAAIATGSLGQAAGALLNPMTIAKGTIKGVGAEARIFAAKMSTANTTLMNSSTRALPLAGNMFKALGTTIGATATFIGKSFMRMIPLVGWLIMAWDLAGLIGNMQVGGAKVSQWLGDWMDELWTMAQTWWMKFTKIFSDDAGDSVTDAAIKKMNDERNARRAKFDKQIAENQKIVAAEKAKRDAAEANAKNASDEKHGSATIGTDGLIGDPVSDYNWGSSDREKRVFEDPFIGDLANMRKKALISAQRTGAAIAETGNDLYAEARTAFREKWIAGDFDPGHDPRKRPFVGKDGQIDWKAKKGGSSAEDWVNQYVEMKKAEDQLKSMQFVKQRVVASEQDLKAAMERTTGETGKQNRDILALERELARAGERLKIGTRDWAAWAAEKNRALETKTGAVRVNFAADFAEEDRKAMTDMMAGGFGQQMSEVDQKIMKDKEQYEQLRQSHEKYYRDEVESYKQMLATQLIDQNTYAAKVQEATDRYTQAAEKAETAWTQHVKVQTEVRARAAESAAARQAREWLNTYSALDKASASWADGFVSNLQKALEGGQADWRDFLRGMVSDMLSIKLKETMSGMVGGAFDGLQKMLNGGLFVNASTAGSGGGLMSGLGSMWNGITGALGFGGGNGAQQEDPAAAATGELANAAANANTALNTMSNQGISGAISSFVSYISSMFTGTAATTAKATAEEAAVIPASSLSVALGEAALAATTFASTVAAASAASTAGSLLPFANGGIMSSAGSLPLRKYARGGVATTPQLALFGEGSMNEAYVPLPDGRSIPVTFSGDASQMSNAGSSNVSYVNIEVNVANDGSSSVNQRQGDDQMWSGAAEKIRSIVLDVITTEKRPNGMLHKNDRG